MKIPCSFVVLNYQGLEELKRCFSSVVAACEYDGWIHDLVLLDNHSDDGGPEWVEANFPRVRVVRRPNNLVCHAFNEIAKDLSHEFCIFLNNDFLVEKSLIQKLLRHFKDPSIVAVSPLLVRYPVERSSFPTLETVAKNVHQIRFQTGYLEMTLKKCRDSEGCDAHTFHASSYGAYRREKFLELGGYDPLLFPFSWIDVDFSYRIWKAGFKVAHERQTFVLDGSPGNTTNRIFGFENAGIIYQRNLFLTTWLNITDKVLLLKSLSHAFLDISKALVRFNFTHLIPHWLCLKATPQIMKTRKIRKKMAQLSDSETIQTINRLCI